MAWQIARGPEANSERPTGRSFGIERLPEELVAPLVAGAYARGIADVLELLAIPAVFLGMDARTLFANRAMQRELGRGLRLEAEHLVAAAPEDNRVLDKLLAEALTPQASTAVISAWLPNAGLTIHAVPVGLDSPNVAQLARAVLVPDTGRDGLLLALIQRITAMRIAEARRGGGANKNVDVASSHQ